MGMSISAKLIYGMKYSDLLKIDCLSEEQIEKLDEDLDDGTIEYASPYYDSEREAWFVGIELTQGFDIESVGVFIRELEKAEREFVEMFGVWGTVRAVKHVY